MLQIKQAVKFSKQQVIYLNHLKELYNGNNLNPDFWDIQNGIIEFDNFKDSIRYQLLVIQRFRCVFCLASLLQEKLEVDHFAPKVRYPEFSFTRTNLFLICGLCNSRAKKGDYDTIAAPSNTKYHLNHFKLVHPIYHKVADEIKYIDKIDLIIDKTRCSGLGIFTVGKFDLDSERMLKVRYHSNQFLNQIELKDPSLLQLARDTITFNYRRRRARAGVLPRLYNQRVF